VLTIFARCADVQVQQCAILSSHRSRAALHKAPNVEGTTMTQPPQSLNLDQSPVVLHQPAGSALAFLIAGTLLFLLAIAILATPGMGFIGPVCLVVGAVSAALGLVMRFKPTTLTLAPEGLTNVNLGIRRTWRWTDVSGFQLTRVRSAHIITFNIWRTKPGGHAIESLYSLPSRWGIDPPMLVKLLNDAQTKWS
jgi:hypothetical protein